MATDGEVQELLLYLLEAIGGLEGKDLEEAEDVLGVELGELLESEVRTYKHVGVLTRDKGLVLKLADGTEVHLTIQAYGGKEEEEEDEEEAG